MREKVTKGGGRRVTKRGERFNGTFDHECGKVTGKTGMVIRERILRNRPLYGILPIRKRGAKPNRKMMGVGG